jgi:hypothetical protein
MGIEALRGRVTPVTSIASSTAPKMPLGEICGLPRFQSADSSSWDRLYQRHRAGGQNCWFLTNSMNGGVRTVYWYRENGGIPFAAVAARPGSKPGSAHISGGLINVRGYATAKAFNKSLPPAMLAISESEPAPENDRSWLIKLLRK